MWWRWIYFRILIQLFHFILFLWSSRMMTLKLVTEYTGRLKCGATGLWIMTFLVSGLYPFVHFHKDWFRYLSVLRRMKRLIAGTWSHNGHSLSLQGWARFAVWHTAPPSSQSHVGPMAVAQPLGLLWRPLGSCQIPIFELANLCSCRLHSGPVSCCFFLKKTTTKNQCFSFPAPMKKKKKKKVQFFFFFW